MYNKIVKSGWIIFLLIFFAAGCSTVEIRSPIVIHTAKKAEREGVAPPVQSGTEIPETTPPEGLKTDTASPASIQVLTDQDMSKDRFSLLGRIMVTSPDKKGFTREQALRELKILAFKRYGALAQGLAKIDYMEKAGLISGDQSLYREASADVATMAATAETSQPGEQAATEGREVIPPLEKIVIVSSDELFNRNFKVLGKVIVRDKTPNGMNEEQAIKSLKIESYRLFGSRAKGLSAVKLKKEDPIYFYKKPQFSPPPQVPDGYNKASAEVLYWP